MLGELTLVWVPDQAHEAIRDLVRARQAAVRTLRQARQQLSGFPPRHGRHYHSTAGRLHRRWAGKLKFDQAVHHIVLEDCIAAVEAAMARRDRLEAHIEAVLPEWSLAPVVEALQALRGVRLVAAATLVAELGDITRFTNPRQLMAYLGLVPSEHSSGRTRRQGGITKAGNGAARRMLIEAAWSLSISCTDRPRAAATARATGQADPRHRMESSGARAAPTVSQARPDRKAADGDHCRDRA